MRICIIGKFPPIQGGVSVRTYWTAHALAARGHEVHVVTNAKEARPPFRMHMRQQDWQRCAASYDNGSVTVHWSDPVDRSQCYIPMASPFVSKLACLAANVHSQRPFDVIYSYYLEPYGVAGHLAAQMTGVPHVVRMAGSDAGRLWHHPQFEALYDHVLRSATVVIAGSVAGRADQAWRAARAHRCRRRLRGAGGFVLPGRARARSCGAAPRGRGRSGTQGYALGRICGRLSLFRHLRQARRDQRIVRAARGDAAAQASRNRGRPGGAGARLAGDRKSLSLRGPRSWASPTASCKFRSFRTGACLSSCAAVSPCAASSRISRSYFTLRSLPWRC